MLPMISDDDVDAADVSLDVLITAEVATLFGVGPEAVRKMVREGRLMATQVGKNYRYNKVYIQRVAAERLAQGKMIKWD